jgi:hypothetical protein
MGETQVELPLFSEKEWGLLLSGISLAENKSREDLQLRRITSAFLEQDEKNKPLSGFVMKAPTPQQEKEDNDLGKTYSDLRHKLYHLRGGLGRLEQQQVNDQLNSEIDKLLGGASEVS